MAHMNHDVLTPSGFLFIYLSYEYELIKIYCYEKDFKVRQLD